MVACDGLSMAAGWSLVEGRPMDAWPPASRARNYRAERVTISGRIRVLAGQRRYGDEVRNFTRRREDDCAPAKAGVRADEAVEALRASGPLPSQGNRKALERQSSPIFAVTALIHGAMSVSPSRRPEKAAAASACGSASPRCSHGRAKRFGSSRAS